MKRYLRFNICIQIDCELILSYNKFKSDSLRKTVKQFVQSIVLSKNQTKKGFINRVVNFVICIINGSTRP